MHINAAIIAGVFSIQCELCQLFFSDYLSGSPNQGVQGIELGAGEADSFIINAHMPITTIQPDAMNFKDRF